MQHTNKNLAFYLWLSGTIAATLVIASFLWQGNLRFSLQDEGYLWYGVQRVLQGEVPIRDFMAYDPGRYYWSAVFMYLQGDNGILSLRAAVAVLQAFGLATGLAVIACSQPAARQRNVIFLIIAAVILLLWMYPRHKLFDLCTSIFLVGALTALIHTPSYKRYFLCGICVGLAAFMGRNHGVYGLIASLGAIAWLNIGLVDFATLQKRCLAFGLGVVTGFSPIILMCIFIPGFALAFWQSILFLFDVGATNVSLPIPWPWTVNVAAPNIQILHKSSMGLFFMVLPIAGGIGIAWLLYLRWKHKTAPAPLVAAVLLILPYTHVAFSRADISHLAQGIFPFLLASIIAILHMPKKLKWVAIFVLLLLSVSAILPSQPLWQCRNGKCTKVDVSGDTLFVMRHTANKIALIERLVTRYAPHGGNFLATPLIPGAYPLTDRVSPMWASYTIFANTEAFQRAEIMRIQAASPCFALVQLRAINNKDDLGFAKTNPLIMAYIQENFSLVESNKAQQYEVYTAPCEERIAKPFPAQPR